MPASVYMLSLLGCDWLICLVMYCPCTSNALSLSWYFHIWPCLHTCCCLLRHSCSVHGFYSCGFLAVFSTIFGFVLVHLVLQPRWFLTWMWGSSEGNCACCPWCGVYLHVYMLPAIFSSLFLHLVTRSVTCHIRLCAAMIPLHLFTLVSMFCYHDVLLDGFRCFSPNGFCGAGEVSRCICPPLRAYKGGG